jgi:serine/threonine-protein kinase
VARDESTTAYPSNGTSTRMRKGRCKVALIHNGSGAHFTSEIHCLLRRRLRLASLITGAGFLFFLVRYLVQTDVSPLGPSAFDLTFHGVVTLIILSLAGLLWGRGQLCLTSLRVIELTMFGLTWAMFAYLHYLFLGTGKLLPIAAPGERPDFYRFANFAVCLRWIILVVIYGTFIPNTLRRCALIVGAIALTPVLISTAILLFNDTMQPYVAAGFPDLVILMGIAASIALFGSYRIHVLHKEAFQARQLGQYQLKQRLGIGGMGEVYLAEHLLLRRPCAIKLISPDKAGDPRALARFEREVQATATLTHWNTVEIFDYGHAEDGTFYYVMEYLPGMSLQDLVLRHGPLPPERAVHLLRQVCGALREAHGIGLIHRDIKPSNILACARGGQNDVAKLLDFGIVRTVGAKGDSARLTQDGAIAGSPQYMSPEQATGRDADRRSDIYSLGAVAYYLLTGRPPFVRDTAMQAVMAHVYDPVTRLAELRPDIPTDLQDVVLRCLEKKPERRFADAASLEKALAACRCAGRWTEERATTWWKKLAQKETVPELAGQATPQTAATS